MPEWTASVTAAADAVVLGVAVDVVAVTLVAVFVKFGRKSKAQGEPAMTPWRYRRQQQQHHHYVPLRMTT